MIKKMSLSPHEEGSLVAKSPAEFIDSAMKIATPGGPRSLLLETLKRQARLLFDDRSTIQDWEEFLERAVRRDLDLQASGK
jgi:hypothetical protein